jgi:hypothetical protein
VAKWRGCRQPIEVITNSGGGDRWERWRKKVGQTELHSKQEDVVVIDGHRITLSILHPHELARSPPFVLMNVLDLHCLGIQINTCFGLIHSQIL